MWGYPVTRFPSLTVTRFPVHVGGTPLQGFYHWQLWKKLHCTCGGPCYKVPIIDSYQVPSTSAGTLLHGSHHWQLQGSHIQIISYMWGDSITRFPHSPHIMHVGGTPLQGSHIPYKVWGTIRVIDNYKVSAVACPCPRGLGALLPLFQPFLVSCFDILPYFIWWSQPFFFGQHVIILASNEDNAYGSFECIFIARLGRSENVWRMLNIHITMPCQQSFTIYMYRTTVVTLLNMYTWC